MNNNFANIAVPMPVYALFTYKVPDAFLSTVVRGTIVKVQFGKRNVFGVVHSLSNVIPAFTVKPIIDVIDRSFAISQPEFSLAEWIADYYAAPLGDTLRLFLPSGFKYFDAKVVALDSSRPDARQLKGPKLKILKSLQEKDRATISQLQHRTGVRNIYSIIAEMEKDHFIVTHDRGGSSPRVKYGWFFSRTSENQEPQLNGKSQQKAWEKIKILSRTEEIAVPDFLKHLNISLSTLRSLEKKNLIVLKQKEIRRNSRLPVDNADVQKDLSLRLNTDQKNAYDTIESAIDKGQHATFLLHGITGSGKTQVYIEAIRHALACDKTAIVLVPEISLTPQTVRRFQIHFGDQVVWIHSKLSTGERYDAWRYAKTGKCKIIIGPRSALYAPLSNVGLIIVDEEHESSYKQFDSQPRYNARDVAVMKGSQCGAVVVLGSATPSVESFYNAQSGKYHLLSLPIRADNAHLPPVTIVNMVDERKRRFSAMKEEAKTQGKKAFEKAARSISSILEQKINERIERKEGIILLQNRRGFAPFLECNDCGAVEQCDHCSVTLTYHATHKHLRCHYCGRVFSPPTVCKQCGGHQLVLRGFGTQRVEEELRYLFPHGKVIRMDLDTTATKNSHEKLLRSFGNGDADILLGTQMVAKGLDFPRVTLVGVISADTQMMLPDFRSAERTFQLLTQVAGRAGRSSLQGEVILQTSQPDHYALAHVKDHNFKSFYEEEIAYRKALKYPPFSRIIAVELKGPKEHTVEMIAQELGEKLSASLKHASILGPAPAQLSKIKNEYRWQIVIKADKEKDRNAYNARTVAIESVSSLQKSSRGTVKITVDVDPASLM